MEGIPYNILDQKLGFNPNPKVFPTTDFADEFQRRTQMLLDSTKKNIMQYYLIYKEYYDRKAKAAPLKQNNYCFILSLITKDGEFHSANTDGQDPTLWKKFYRMKITKLEN